jgi:myosin-crossreactive antigen
MKNRKQNLKSHFDNNIPTKMPYITRQFQVKQTSNQQRKDSLKGQSHKKVGEMRVQGDILGP